VKTGGVSAEFVRTGEHAGKTRGEEYAGNMTVFRSWHVSPLRGPFLKVWTNWKTPDRDGKERRAPGTQRWRVRTDGDDRASLIVPGLGFSLSVEHQGELKVGAQLLYLVRQGDVPKALHEENGVLEMVQRHGLMDGFLSNPTAGTFQVDGALMRVDPATPRDLIDPARARRAARAMRIDYVVQEHSIYVPMGLFHATVEKAWPDLRVVSVFRRLSMDSRVGYEPEGPEPEEPWAKFFSQLPMESRPGHVLHLSGPWTRGRTQLPVQTLWVVPVEPKIFTLNTSFDLAKLDHASLVRVLEHALELGEPEVNLPELPAP
jgi:hypothetical protein